MGGKDQPLDIVGTPPLCEGFWAWDLEVLSIPDLSWKAERLAEKFFQKWTSVQASLRAPQWVKQRSQHHSKLQHIRTWCRAKLGSSKPRQHDWLCRSWAQAAITHLSPKLIQETSWHRRSSFDSVAETSLAAFDERLGPNHAGVEVLSSTCQQRVWFQLESCELFSAGLCPMPPNGIVTSAHHRKQVPGNSWACFDPSTGWQTQSPTDRWCKRTPLPQTDDTDAELAGKWNDQWRERFEMRG